MSRGSAVGALVLQAGQQRIASTKAHRHLHKVARSARSGFAASTPVYADCSRCGAAVFCAILQRPGVEREAAASAATLSCTNSPTKHLRKHAHRLHRERSPLTRHPARAGRSASPETMANTAVPVGGRASPTISTSKGARHEDRAAAGHGGAKEKSEKGLKFLNFGLLGLVLLGWLAWLIMLAGAPPQHAQLRLFTCPATRAPRTTRSCTFSLVCEVRIALPQPARLGRVVPHVLRCASAPCRGRLLPARLRARCPAHARSHRLAARDCAPRLRAATAASPRPCCEAR
jgi:hypothetical protein